MLTTRCSSAFALIASCWVVLCAQSPVPQPHRGAVQPQPAPAPASAKANRTEWPLAPVQTLWTLSLNNQLTALPAYDATQVYFPIDGDRLVAYTLATGEQQWIAPIRPLMNPAAGDGLVFVVEAGTLTALYATVGWTAWQVPFTEKLATPPVYDNGWLIVAGEAGEIGALRASDGDVIWRRDLKSPARARPALAADRVYVPTADNRVVALRVDTGEPIWERRLGGTPDEILALDDRVYVGAKDNFFYCLMAKDGRVDWRWRIGADAIGTPRFRDGRVFFVALDNVLRALNFKSGAQEWMRPLPIRPAWGPALAGSTVVVSGQTPSMKAFDMKDGKPAGELPAGAEAAAPPQVFEDPLTNAPMVLMIARDIARGATATLVGHSFEPPISPVAALPNLVMIAPTTPRTPR